MEGQCRSKSSLETGGGGRGDDTFPDTLPISRFIILHLEIILLINYFTHKLRYIDKLVQGFKGLKNDL